MESIAVRRSGRNRKKTQLYVAGENDRSSQAMQNESTQIDVEYDQVVVKEENLEEEEPIDIEDFQCSQLRIKIEREENNINNGEPFQTINPEINLQNQSQQTVNNKLYECLLCHNTFLYKYKLVKHLYIHLPDAYRKYKCEYCTKGFQYLSYLNVHTKLHLKAKELFKCNICNMIFRFKRTLDNHLKYHLSNEETQFQCDTCNKLFFYKFNLDICNDVHLSKANKSLRCDFCKEKRSTSPKKELGEHEKTYLSKVEIMCENNVSDEKFINRYEIQCNVCHKALSIKTILSKYIKIHLSAQEVHNNCIVKEHSKNKLNKTRKIYISEADIPQNCIACNKILYKTILSDHYYVQRKYRETHSVKPCLTEAEKKHSCDICKRDFAKKHYLTLHRRTHLTETGKPLQCDVCKKTFKKKTRLTEHKKTHLPEAEKPYSCQSCEKKFIYVSLLRLHEFTHLPKSSQPFSCNFCEARFACKYRLTAHSKIHLIF